MTSALNHMLSIMFVILLFFITPIYILTLNYDMNDREYMANTVQTTLETIADTRMFNDDMRKELLYNMASIDGKWECEVIREEKTILNDKVVFLPSDDLAEFKSGDIVTVIATKKGNTLFDKLAFSVFNFKAGASNTYRLSKVVR